MFLGNAADVVHCRFCEAFNGQFPITNMDIVHGLLWDSVKFEAGHQFNHSRQLFTYCDATSGKTLAETNMTQPNRLDAPEAFSISRFLFTFSRDTSDRDVYGVAENFAFSFWMGQKRFASAPIVSLMPVGRDIEAPIRICGYLPLGLRPARSLPRLRRCGVSLSHMPGFDAGRQFVLDLTHRLSNDARWGKSSKSKR